MLEQLIKISIENKTRELVNSNLFMKKAQDGSLSRKEVALYLHNLAQLFSKATEHLSIGSVRAEMLGFHDVSHFLKDKIKEEIGHENWPKQDLKTFQENENDLHVTKATEATLDYIRSLVKSDPRQYLIYMAFVEYFTVLAGPEFVKNLEEKCGISRTSMTAITKHQESDKDHIQEDLEAIAKLANAAHLEQSLLGTLQESAQKIGDLFNSCLTKN